MVELSINSNSSRSDRWNSGGDRIRSVNKKYSPIDKEGQRRYQKMEEAVGENEE